MRPTPPHHAQSGASQAGFTRIEVFAICGVVLLLLGVLLATLIRARDSTRRTECQRHLAQIGQAMSNYAAEHENRYPKDWKSDRTTVEGTADETSPTGFWCNRGFDASLRSYLKSPRVFVCPGDVWLNQNVSTWGVRNTWDDTSYGINAFVQNRPVASVANPAETILLGHTRFEHTLFEDIRNVLWDTHQGGNNYLFCDGRVQFLTGPATLIPKNLWKNR